MRQPPAGAAELASGWSGGVYRWVAEGLSRPTGAEHLRSRVPWGMRCDIRRVSVGDPFVGSVSRNRDA